MRSDGAFGTRDGAGEEEAAHAGDQTSKLGASAGGCREPEPASGEGDGGFLFHAGGPCPGCTDKRHMIQSYEANTVVVRGVSGTRILFCASGYSFQRKQENKGSILLHISNKLETKMWR